MIALPGDPGNGLHIGELPQPVKVEIAYAGSCTAGKKEDMDMYARVLTEAVDRGEKVAPWVRFFIQCGSQDVKRYCEERATWTCSGRWVRRSSSRRAAPASTLDRGSRRPKTK